MSLSYAIPTQIVTAWPQDRNGKPGYAVLDADGTTSWSPKALVDESWLPLGYIDHLSPDEQAVVAQMEELVDRTDKLEEFMDTEEYDALSQDERELLKAQYDIYGIAIGVLNERVERFGDTESDDD